MNGYRSLLLGCLLPMAFGQPAFANLIQDASFETPNVAPGMYLDKYVGNTFGNGNPWHVIGPPGTDVSIIGCPYSENGYNFVARTGTQFVDLTGDGSNQAEGVQQTVTTVAGRAYKLTFYVGNVTGSSFGTSSTVNVYINNNLVMTATNSGGGTTINWKHFVYGFVANSTSTTVAFINGDPPGDNFNGLDTISLT